MTIINQLKCFVSVLHSYAVHKLVYDIETWYEFDPYFYVAYISRGYGSVVRLVAPNTRDSRFESSHRQNLFAFNCIEKTKIKETRPGMAQIARVIKS